MRESFISKFVSFALSFGFAVKLIQLLLPLYDNDGRKFTQNVYADIRAELTDKFGGLTTFSRAPAQGLWKDKGGTSKDDIVIFEVMAAELDLAWWRAYRSQLERKFRQDSIVIRAQDILLL